MCSTGDGYDDLVVSAPGTTFSDTWVPGPVFLFHGPLSDVYDADDADRGFVGRSPSDLAGWALAAADVTGDGLLDWWWELARPT